MDEELFTGNRGIPLSIAERTSSFVILPFGPVPLILSSGIPFVLAIFLASGDAEILESEDSESTGIVFGFCRTVFFFLVEDLDSKALFEDFFSSFWTFSFLLSSLAGSGMSGIASPSAPITIIGLPTGACSPSSTRIFNTNPSSKFSNSMVALSVSISQIMSPAETLSPSFMFQLTTVPIFMVSLSLGISIIAAIIFSFF